MFIATPAFGMAKTVQRRTSLSRGRRRKPPLLLLLSTCGRSQPMLVLRQLIGPASAKTPLFERQAAGLYPDNMANEVGPPGTIAIRTGANLDGWNPGRWSGGADVPSSR